MSETKNYGPLPDGSGFVLGSFPLPKDHWIYQGEGDLDSPAPFLRGTDDPDRKAWAQKIIEAARFAIRGATRHGKEMDFDPDALVLNMVVGMLGYWTPDGTHATRGVQCTEVRVEEKTSDAKIMDDEWGPYFIRENMEATHIKFHKGPEQTPPAIPQSFLPGLGTIRECLDCKCLVAGGPTRCMRCAKEVSTNRRQRFRGKAPR